MSTDCSLNPSLLTKNLPVPVTSNLYAGDVVPMPNPVEVRRICSDALIPKTKGILLLEPMPITLEAKTLEPNNPMFPLPSIVLNKLFALTSPATSNLYKGVILPIPTFVPSSNTILFPNAVPLVHLGK